MAKTKFKWRTKYKKRGRRSSNSGGGMKPYIDGVMAGAGGQIAQRWLGDYGHPVATVVVGHFRKNPVLKTEGARELGAMLVNNLPFFGGGTTGNGGGAFE